MLFIERFKRFDKIHLPYVSSDLLNIVDGSLVPLTDVFWIKDSTGQVGGDNW